MSPLKSVLSFRAAPSVQKEEPAGETLLGQYKAMRQQTEALVAPLTPEDQMVQSCPQTSPAKWHLAHTSWFFETFILAQHLKDYRPFHPQFRNLFNSYYNAVGAQPEKAIRSAFSRPGLEEIQKYRRHIDEHMHKLLETGTPADEVARLVELGINHEQQHQELLVTDIKHAFWTNPLRPAYQTTSAATSVPGDVPAQKPHSYPEGICEIGANKSSFHFDNESPRHKVYLQPFRFANRLVTCGEYLAFMDDRGYSRPELWLSDGWLALQANKWESPLYWEKSGHMFTCAGMRKIDEHEPVCHVSYYEADAFARWAGARLPSEFEWEVAASEAKPEGNLLEDGRFHPAAASASGNDKPVQIFGDVWEWTASGYLPYPGYKPAAGALGEYNGKFMCNQMVLRGGSCVTARSHIRPSYRNFFTPETRWQFSGIRLADDSV
ncbi:MAG: ergothioneine biosynthesis protein EgtB [Candidatus Angelobacter sp. Gp1-AA117]|nr:MAG: ergothioneine biosynthesis protein EgtB [Candidatus Angelobacter sp. Gp1-AA117]